jgi:drug/metabolite transporter (DMT)-like permease
LKLRDWGAFVLLGLLWGSSFLWIKIALEEIGPFTLVAFRLLFGAAGLLVVTAVRRPSLRLGACAWAMLGLMAFTNTALPFILISWGEQHIDSSMASILNGTVPLFTLIIAHVFLHDERITLNRVLGLLAGFVGVIILMSPNLEPSAGRSGLWGQMAVLLASLLYAGSSVFIRRNLRGIPPIVQSAAIITLADLMAWLMAPVVEAPLHIPTLGLTWVALAWLGLLGSCLAYLLYFHLLNTVGATRTTTVTYVLPVVGLALGVVFLDESLTWLLAAGTGMIVAGIWLVNTNWRPAFARQRPEAAHEPGESAP